MIEDLVLGRGVKMSLRAGEGGEKKLIQREVSLNSKLWPIRPNRKTRVAALLKRRMKGHCTAFSEVNRPELRETF